MKSILSLLVHALRRLFYNTPVRNWRVTELVYAIVGRLLIGRNPYPVIHLSGIKLKTNGKDIIVTAALANGNYEPFTLRIFQQLIGESLAKDKNGACVFFDVGANIGLFTVTAALLDSRVRIFAFEPNPVSYQLLQENLILNGTVGVSAEQAAVGEVRGLASLDVSSPQAGMHSIYGSGAQRVQVPVISLDDFCAEKQVLPSLIKVDVEGYEPRVLEGMKGFPPSHEFQMILEFNPEHLKRGGHVPEDFLDELLSRFDFIYCLDEIEQGTILYEQGDMAVRRKIIGFGYNLLLIRGLRPQFFSEDAGR